ncbi:hypothetical protein SMICM304S_09707 [Streptomyces microflavus]
MVAAGRAAGAGRAPGRLAGLRSLGHQLPLAEWTASFTLDIPGEVLVDFLLALDARDEPVFPVGDPELVLEAVTARGSLQTTTNPVPGRWTPPSRPRSASARCQPLIQGGDPRALTLQADDMGPLDGRRSPNRLRIPQRSGECHGRPPLRRSGPLQHARWPTTGTAGPPPGYRPAGRWWRQAGPQPGATARRERPKIDPAVSSSRRPTASPSSPTGSCPAASTPARVAASASPSPARRAPGRPSCGTASRRTARAAVLPSWNGMNHGPQSGSRATRSLSGSAAAAARAAMAGGGAVR